MKKFLNSFAATLLIAIMALTTTSCNSNEPNNPDDKTLYEFVTLVANTDQGSTFQFQKDGDSPVLTLTSTRKLPEDAVKVGERLMIAYTPVNGIAQVSGPINLLAYRSVYNGEMVVAPATDWDSFMTQDQRLTYLTRTGNYINVSSEIYVLNQPKKYQLVCDQATVNDEYPVCYIIFISDTSGDGVMKVGYGSWDISDVWNLKSCKGIKVRLSNLDGRNEFTFKKTAQDTPTPMD